MSVDAEARRLIKSSRYDPSNVDSDPELDTKCSWYVADVACAVGNRELLNLNANAQVQRMRNRPQSYKRVSLEEGQAAANGGCLVILGWQNPKPVEPGHTCLILPGSLSRSKRWGKDAPNVASVGWEKHLDKPASFAFGQEKVQALECYVWLEKLSG